MSPVRYFEQLKLDISLRKYNELGLVFLVTSLKMLQYDWLMKCKDIVIMTL